MKVFLKEKIIPGLPKTEDEAVRQIKEIENSPSDWTPLNSVLDRIEKQYGVYAY